MNMALASLNENATVSVIRRALATTAIATQPEPPSGMTPRALCFRDGPVMLLLDASCTRYALPRVSEGHLPHLRSRLSQHRPRARRQGRYVSESDHINSCNWPQLRHETYKSQAYKGTCHNHLDTPQPAPPSGMTPRALCFRDGPVTLLRLSNDVRGTYYPRYQTGTCHICDHSSASPALGHDAKGAMFQSRTCSDTVILPQRGPGRTCPDYTGPCIAKR